MSFTLFWKHKYFALEIITFLIRGKGFPLRTRIKNTSKPQFSCNNKKWPQLLYIPFWYEFCWIIAPYFCIIMNIPNICLNYHSLWYFHAIYSRCLHTLAGNNTVKYMSDSPLFIITRWNSLFFCIFTSPFKRLRRYFYIVINHNKRFNNFEYINSPIQLFTARLFEPLDVVDISRGLVL